MSTVLPFPAQPLRRVLLVRTFAPAQTVSSGWRCIVAVNDGGRAPGFGMSDVYPDLNSAARVGAGLSRQTGLPLDLDGWTSPRRAQALRQAC